MSKRFFVGKPNFRVVGFRVGGEEVRGVLVGGGVVWCDVVDVHWCGVFVLWSGWLILEEQGPVFEVVL